MTETELLWAAGINHCRVAACWWSACAGEGPAWQRLHCCSRGRGGKRADRVDLPMDYLGYASFALIDVY